MTIKELANFTGKTERTIQNWVKKSNEVFSLDSEKITLVKGQETNLTIDQVETVLRAGSMSKDAVTILMKNARQEATVLPTNNSVDYIEIGKMIAMAVTSAMTPILQELKQPQQNKPLQIEHVPEKSSRAIFKQEIGKLVALSKSDWSTTYNAVYSEMGYVYNVKVKARAKNRNVASIQVLEDDGLMGKAIAITRQMIERLGE